MRVIHSVEKTTFVNYIVHWGALAVHDVKQLGYQLLALASY
tara:strand:+ start:731 stop:853 length:123 start_codon:yes stop_codon:yes gene_type:complete